MDENEVKEIVESFRKSTADLNAFRERVDAIEKATGSIPGDLQEIREKINADFAEKFLSKQDGENLLGRFDEIDTRLELLKDIQAEAKVEDKEHVNAFRDCLRTAWGTKGEMDEETRKFMGSEEYRNYRVGVALYNDGVTEVRTLTEGTAEAGGLFVPPEVEARILKNVVDIDPVRPLAEVISISTNEVKGFRRTGTPTAYHDTEIGTGTASQAEWADYNIGVYPLTVMTPVSADLLADVRFVESEVISDANQAFAYTEGVDFVEGTGVDRAMGFTTNVGTDDAIYPAAVTGTGTNVIAAGDIPKMWGTLKAPYRANATWVFNSDSFIKLLSLKDANNRYYLTADGGLVAGPPTMLYGRPFAICETLDDEGADKYPLWFGDFRNYRIVDRSGIQLMRDIYTVYPRVYFKMRKRVGGQVMKAEGLKGLLTT